MLLRSRLGGVRHRTEADGKKRRYKGEDADEHTAWNRSWAVSSPGFLSAAHGQSIMGGGMEGQQAREHTDQDG